MIVQITHVYIFIHLIALDDFKKKSEFLYIIFYWSVVSSKLSFAEDFQRY